MADALASQPFLPLVSVPTAIEELGRLRSRLGVRPRIVVKRDDAIGFAFGGNKVRKLAFVAAEARADGCDTLITCGGVQSNHARVTAITAATHGMRCILVVNGERPARLSANALLDDLAGAEVRYVASRDERAPAMEAAADEVRRSGGRPFVIPLGASVPKGAAAFVAAIDELLTQTDPPDVIVHASSSGGTQAGLSAGCVRAGVPTRVIGVSADETSAALEAQVRELHRGLGTLLAGNPRAYADAVVEVDDTQIGEGYGLPTAASLEAAMLMLRTEGIAVDHTYTAKALAGMIARLRRGDFDEARTVMFWHTGGQVGLFA